MVMFAFTSALFQLTRDFCLYPWIGHTGFSEGGLEVKKCGLYVGIYGKYYILKMLLFADMG